MAKKDEVKEEPEWKGKIRIAINKFREKEFPLWHNTSTAEYVFKYLEKELEL